MENRRTFGIIPAAGRSQRMGTHKLLMPWQDGRVIDAVLAAWTHSIINHIVVVLRTEDQPLVDACKKWPVEILQLDQATADMKQSIQKGLEHFQTTLSPTPTDVCLTAPADLPQLKTETIGQVALAIQSNFVVPVYGDKIGHPIGFPWSSTQQIFELRDDEGLNKLIERSDTDRLKLDSDLRPRDIDTPLDYQREKKSLAKKRTDH